MNKIKIAQIGTSDNSHGNDIFNILKSADDIFEVAGYAMPENEKEKIPHRMKDFKGFREMTVDEILNDPTISAVAVETEEMYLTKYALLAAKHKKHIHMEKPGSADLADFEELIKTCRTNKTVFHTGYMYRYNPVIKKLMKDIKNGDYGEIISVEAQMNCWHSDNVRKWLKNFKGGMMFFLGCHLADLVLQIKGDPKNIIPLNKSTGISGIESEDYAMAVFEYDNGISFIKSCDAERGGYARRRLVVNGSKKSIELCPLEMYSGSGNLLFTDSTEYSETDNWGDRGNFSHSENYERFYDMMISFAKMVRGEIENPYTYDYELKLYKTVLKCCGFEI